MATTFCNDKDIAGHGFISVDRGVNTDEIIDAIGRVDYHVRNKMGSSIPTIFSRMFLFNSAYIDVTKRERTPEERGRAHLGILGADGQILPNVYNHIISEHLDMLEFLFKKGTKMRIVRWDIRELNRLTHRNDFGELDPDMKCLGEAIDDAITKTPSLQALDQIHLFEYEGFIVGGTSPQSVVYTNPNWAEAVERNEYQFDGLFGSTVRALHERDLTFRKLLYWQYKRGDFRDSRLSEFGEYIDNSFNNYDDNLRTEWRVVQGRHVGHPVSEWIDKEIADLAIPMEDSLHAAVSSPLSGVPLYTNRPVPVNLSNSQYIIKPGTADDVWKKEEVNGAERTLKEAPYILPPYGISGARYFQDINWDNRIHHVPAYASIKDVQLSERMLPGIDQKVPFLTIDDLLEDKMIEMAFSIDNKHFYTGTVEKMPYLLPIKKEFFRFFTLADLRNMLTVTQREVEDDMEVTVKLDIPMKKWPRPIQLTRIYTSKEDNQEGHKYPIVDCHKNTNAFNVGIFPFFKMDDEKQNVFDIMVGQTSHPVKMALYQFDHLAVGPLTIVNEGERANSQTNNISKGTIQTHINTRHQRISHSFDIIEFTVQGATGIALPLMETKRTGNQSFVFAVDFGTTNTHIAWADSSNLNAMKPFTIEESDVQVVFMHDATKGNTFTLFNQEARRELPPRFIGKAEGNYCKLPMRTSVYEIENLRNATNPEMFCHLNIGFNFQNEIKKNFSGNRYETDLKWNLSDVTTSKLRVKTYFRQLLWLLRNKSVLNGGGNNFKVIITYPQAMRPSQFSNIRTAWQEAQKEYGFGEPIKRDNFKIESLAPFARLRNKIEKGLLSNETFMNVDIGGGSTDILYLNPKIHKCLSYSAFFAANDLWGVGNDPAHEDSKENGFTKAYRKATTKEEELQKLDDYLAVAKNASDVVSHLFSMPETDFGGKISSSPVKNVLITHFAAVIYYLAQIIKNDELAVPSLISFTGMGSKYIELISVDDEEIANLINTIFSLCGLESKVRINREENPKEVTAEGAVLMVKPLADYNAPNQHNIYGVKDEDEETFKGEDVKTDAVRKRAVDQVLAFTEMLQRSEFVQAVANSGSEFNVKKLMEFGLNNRDSLEASYDHMTKSLREDEMESVISDALFFWPLKDTLFNVAVSLANSL